MKKPRKKYLLMALVAMLAMSVAACGEAAKINKPPKPAATATTTTDTTADPADTDGDGIADDADSDPYSPNNSSDDNAPTEDDSAPSEDEDTPKQTQHGLNEWGQDDGMRVKVLSMTKVSYIPPAPPAWLHDGVKDKAGSSLISVRVEVKNAGKQAIDPLCGGGSGFVLLDQADRNFNALDKLLDINDNVCGDGIQPGFKSTYTIAYRLPAGSQIGGLVVWNDDADDDYDGTRTQLAFTPVS